MRLTDEWMIPLDHCTIKTNNRNNTHLHCPDSHTPSDEVRGLDSVRIFPVDDRRSFRIIRFGTVHLKSFGTALISGGTDRKFQLSDKVRAASTAIAFCVGIVHRMTSEVFESYATRYSRPFGTTLMSSGTKRKP